MRIGIYGGSFDPLHIGHVAMAGYVAQWGGVDQVWLMVSPENPLKSGQYRTPESQRLAMARAAVGDDPRVKVSDFEFSLPRPSYTFATLEALAAAWPEHQFVLIIGADNWRDFQLWRNPDEIISRYGVIVYPRAGCDVSGSLPEGVSYLSDAPLVEVSSSFIRSAIAEGKSMRYFMPDSVARAVEAYGLYKTDPLQGCDPKNLSNETLNSF